MHFRLVDGKCVAYARFDSTSLLKRSFFFTFLLSNRFSFLLFFGFYHFAIGQGVRENSPAHWYKNRSVVKASMKARQMLTWILGKEDSKFKNCENLQVL